MKLKGLAVAAALMVLGMFLFMNYLERQQVRELSRKKPAPAMPANMPQTAPEAPSPEVVSDLGRLRDTVIKECVAKFNASAGAGAPTAGVMESTPLRAMVRSVSCEALAEKNVGKCSALKDLSKNEKTDRGMSAEDDCRYLYYALRGVASATQGSPEAMGFCVESFKMSSPFKENKLDAVCRLWVDAHKALNAGTVCQDMSAYLRDGVPPNEFMAQCRIFADGSHDPKSCYASTDPFTRTHCLDEAAVYAAAKAKDPGLCGGVEACRGLLMGSVEACGPLKEKGNEAYCTARAVEDIRALYGVEMQFRFENSLPAYKPGDNILTRMSPEEKKRAVEDLQRTSKR